MPSIMVAHFASWSLGLGASVCSYVDQNTRLVERLAAEADGVPLWSWAQVPWALLAGLIVVACSYVLVGTWSAVRRSLPARSKVRTHSEVPKE